MQMTGLIYKRFRIQNHIVSKEKWRKNSPNGAGTEERQGKSNFLELFKLLRASMKLPLPGFMETDLKKYVLDSGTAADFMFKGKPEATRIYFKLEFGQNGYGMVLVPTLDDLLRIDSEGTYYKGIDHWYRLHSPDGFTPALLADKESKGVVSNHGVGYSINVSIHAPAKGATKVRGLWHKQPVCFNPRTREGCDDTTSVQH